jgi:hypothetical protein
MSGEQLFLETDDRPEARRSREWHAINSEIRRVYGALTSHPEIEQQPIAGDRSGRSIGTLAQPLKTAAIAESNIAVARSNVEKIAEKERK